jgi:hypothetical protein
MNPKDVVIEHERQLRLHFEGTQTSGHRLPAGPLVKALQCLQRIVHLLALEQGGRPVQQRARITYEIERKYPIVCGVPQNGGYALPISIGDRSSDLFAEDDIASVDRRARDVISAVNAADSDKLSQLVPDRAFRRNIIKAFDEMLPPKRSGLIVHIEDDQAVKLLDGERASEAISSITAALSEEPLNYPGSVFGNLIAMDFQDRKLRLQLLGSGRALDATYKDDFEPVLLENPRGLIQVTGNIVRDPTGSVVAITNVEKIEEVDETSVEIRALEGLGARLRSRRPLLFSVQFDRELELYVCQGPFGIYTAAQTRDEIVASVEAELIFLWSEVALASDNALSSDALALKKELLDSLEVADAV